MSLISSDADFILWALMLLIAALAFTLEKTSAIGQKMGGPIIVLTATAALSNLQIIPKAAPVYDTIWTYGVPVAVVLLLFDANLKKIFLESGRTLLAFGLGAIGTTLGVLLGVFLLPLGESTPELAAVFSATYIGGSLNFAAVSEAVSFKDADLLTASLAADNVVGTLFLCLLIALPSFRFIAKSFGHKDESDDKSDENTEPDSDIGAPFSGTRAAAALGIGFLIIAISDAAAGLIGRPELRLLFATALTVALASLAHRRMSNIVEAFPIGMLIMYLFFGLIGAGVDLIAMFKNGLMLAAFATIILVTHLLTILTLGRLLRVGLPEILVGSNACVLGPPSAAAMAGANGWRDLVTPAILCGTFGYAIANFLGLTLYATLGG